MDEVKAAFRAYEDFPKPGVVFYDINPVLRDPVLFNRLLDHLVERYRPMQPAKIVGLESRGYYLAVPLAQRLGVPFIPFRKPGKVPGPLHLVEYGTEYSHDAICVQQDAIAAGDRIVIIDDLLATGGTAAAAIELTQKAGGEVVEMHCHVELPALEGIKKLGDTPFYSLVRFEK